jgi:hypothetical protein
MRKVFQNLIRPMFVLILTMVFSAASAQNITVQLRDSDGNAVPDANTATLQYWNSGWVTLAPNDGFGNFIVPTSLLPANVKMDYKLSTEERQLTGSETSPVMFNTVTLTAIVKDGDGNTITAPVGYWTYRQTTWPPSVDVGVTQEVLPGIYDIHMELHTSEQVRTGVQVSLANDPQTEVFTTVTVTPQLLDCLGNVVDVANNPDYEFRHGHTGPCPYCNLNTGIELLPGSEQAFWYLYKGVEVERIGNYPPNSGTNTPYFVPNEDSYVTFTSTQYVVQLRDSEGNIVPNANEAYLQYYDAGWKSIASNDGNGNFYVDPSLLPVEVKMVYNASSENRMLTATGCSEVFTTVTFTAIVQDAEGNTLTTPLGYYNHRQNTWRGNLDAGVLEEILPGTHYVHMVFNTSKLVRSGVQVTLANDPHVEVFTTVTITPRLRDGQGNDMASTPGWSARHGSVGSANCYFNVGMELLPGAQQGFILKYNGSIVDRIGNYTPNNVINPIYYVPNVDSEVVFTVSTPKTDLANMSENLLYPNPASNAMSYTYFLNEDSPVYMSIYSAVGEEVMLIENDVRTSGKNVSEWDVSSLKPGVYILRAIIGSEVLTERFVKTQ